jgi:glycosyltransferase involved in cell wall biosynthesis
MIMVTAARILYITINMELGGTERQLYELVTGLRTEQFSPHLCCLRGAGALADDLKQRGFPVTAFRFTDLDYDRKLRSVGQLRVQVAELAQLVRRLRPSIVHCMLPVACVTGGIASRLARVPLLVTSRRSLGCYKEGRFVLRQLENMVNHWAAAVVANSTAVMDDTVSREWIDRRKLRVIYNGVRVPEARPGKGWREVTGTPIDGPAVCLVANFFPYKGHRDFIAAASIVAREMPAVKFILVGNGKLRREIERQVAGLGLEQRMIFLGIRPDSVGIMALSDVVALSSYEEGFPNVVLEAMAAGRPVVATRVGGVPEVVEDGLTGLLVPQRDPAGMAAAILHLLRNKAAAEEMGRRGLERVKREFSMRKMVQSYEELYSDLLCARGIDTVGGLT